MNDKVYIPTYNNNNCAYIYNSDVIRVYESHPTQNSTINYKDYYIKSQYIYNEGTTYFNQYSTIPTCLNSSRITTDIYYRNDIAQILIIFIIMAICCFVVPWRIFVRLFRRYQ